MPAVSYNDELEYNNLYLYIHLQTIASRLHKMH